MEYKELELLWKQYDEKLDNLEKINKKLLKEKLVEKPQKKLNFMKYSSVYGLIATPIILVVALHPAFTKENMDWKFILGCILTLGGILYLSVENFRIYFVLKKIDIGFDSTIQSLDKIVKLKKISNSNQKCVILYYPLMYIAVLLIGWNSFVFSRDAILFLVVFFIITFYLNIWGAGRYKDRIFKLEKDIAELKEYTEE